MIYELSVYWNILQYFSARYIKFITFNLQFGPKKLSKIMKSQLKINNNL